MWQQPIFFQVKSKAFAHQNHHGETKIIWCRLTYDSPNQCKIVPQNGKVCSIRWLPLSDRLWESNSHSTCCLQQKYVPTKRVVYPCITCWTKWYCFVKGNLHYMLNKTNLPVLQSKQKMQCKRGCLCLWYNHWSWESQALLQQPVREQAELK